MGNSQKHERFFKLLAKVLMLVLNGNRYIYYVYGVLSGERALVQDIKVKNWEQRINERLGLILSNPETFFDSAIEALQEILDGPKPVFVEFTVKKPSTDECGDIYFGEAGEKVYFVGTSLEDILQDTNQGQEHGRMFFSGYVVVSDNFVRSLPISYLDDGVASVKKGCWCYQLKLEKKR